MTDPVRIVVGDLTSTRVRYVHNPGHHEHPDPELAIKAGTTSPGRAPAARNPLSKTA